MKQNQYSRRVNELAREKLASILLLEISDPDLALVTLTGVEVSVDKSLLRAFVSCDAARYDEVTAALARARGRIRALLGRSLGWRVTPELDFRIDTTTDEAERITRALEDVPPTIGVEKDEEGYPVGDATTGDAPTTDDGE
ncbi:30S ribosome-binding factor RbfA [Thermophilibacter immobilis]|jgi:ribosome-binding factor A|uniref:Ribosome-binding factor A n=1 Tax=Thermophilibacter immobilis TaxID=2779519 RepID=A0A7S7M9V9_9ACTN|nr:30S ribosome-binding factor RbfA [Thermophilibacter immobilis]QOY61434.1 30S ribosome-binding factor RbfA [Thermophilibacter immobilis]